jgi:FKBP-type peptidyl-prolyl cis-trans isomerase 2
METVVFVLVLYKNCHKMANLSCQKLTARRSEEVCELLFNEEKYKSVVLHVNDYRGGLIRGDVNHPFCGSVLAIQITASELQIPVAMVAEFRHGLSYRLPRLI